MSHQKLHVIIGATGVGKSSYALELATEWSCPIISADSRQVYKGMQIGTASPTSEELKQVPHYFVQTKEVTEEYSAMDYAEEARKVIAGLFQYHDKLLLVGGSMLYLKSFLEGYDSIPPPAPTIRENLWKRFYEEGVKPLQKELQKIDAPYLARIDANNHKRIIRALEVYQTTGRTYSSFHTDAPTLTHPYEIEIISIERPREFLYKRIEERVEKMFIQGLVEEVKHLLPYRHLNALNTIGYKEVFQYLDKIISESECKQLIKKHTKVYARQQIRYFKRWLTPESSFPYEVITLE